MEVKPLLRVLILMVSANIAGVEAVAEEGSVSTAVHTEMPPHRLVEEVTGDILSDIDKYRSEPADKGTSDSQRMQAFFKRLDRTLVKVVDFDWIAVNVMGVYRKSSTEEQRARFTEAFRRGLVETYGRGLLAYNNQEIVVHPPQEDIGGKRRVSVVQEIRSDDGKYPLVYSMGLNREGQWKVINVIINGINLGKTFRNQFLQAAQKYDGDIDKVIANWRVEQG